jgi:hypothetical protein
MKATLDASGSGTAREGGAMMEPFANRAWGFVNGGLPLMTEIGNADGSILMRWSGGFAAG